MHFQNFQEGEKVWAKFSDYPYWPAQIASKSKTEILQSSKGQDGVGVLFYGYEPTYALVRDVEEFEANYERLSKAYDSEEFRHALEQIRNMPYEVEPPLQIKPSKRRSSVCKRRASVSNKRRQSLSESKASDGSVEESKSVENNMSVGENKFVGENNSLEGNKLAEKSESPEESVVPGISSKSVDDSKYAEASKSVDESKSTDGVRSDDIRSIEATKSTDECRSVDDSRSLDDARSIEGDSPETKNDSVPGIGGKTLEADNSEMQQIVTGLQQSSTELQQNNSELKQSPQEIGQLLNSMGHGESMVPEIIGECGDSNGQATCAAATEASLNTMAITEGASGEGDIVGKPAVNEEEMLAAEEPILAEEAIAKGSITAEIPTLSKQSILAEKTTVGENGAVDEAVLSVDTSPGEITLGDRPVISAPCDEAEPAEECPQIEEVGGGQCNSAVEKVEKQKENLDEKGDSME